MSTVICNLCTPPRQMPTEALFHHLERDHGRTFEIEKWPDGEPVVIDNTLEPDDFVALCIQCDHPVHDHLPEEHGCTHPDCACAQVPEQ